MKKAKHAVTLALGGLFTSFGANAHAEITAAGGRSSNIASFFPLAVFAVAAVVVYLFNRPRVMVRERVRRRTDSPRNEVR
jgi:hypothetical protein